MPLKRAPGMVNEIAFSMSNTVSSIETRWSCTNMILATHLRTSEGAVYKIERELQKNQGLLQSGAMAYYILPFRHSLFAFLLLMLRTWSTRRH